MEGLVVYELEKQGRKLRFRRKGDLGWTRWMNEEDSHTEMLANCSHASHKVEFVGDWPKGKKNDIAAVTYIIERDYVRTVELEYVGGRTETINR